MGISRAPELRCGSYQHGLEHGDLARAAAQLRVQQRRVLHAQLVVPRGAASSESSESSSVLSALSSPTSRPSTRAHHAEDTRNQSSPSRSWSSASCRSSDAARRRSAPPPAATPFVPGRHYVCVASICENWAVGFRNWTRLVRTKIDRTFRGSSQSS